MERVLPMMNGEPQYWMHETSGKLAPVIKAYLLHEPLTDEGVAIMRAYLRQWIMAPGFTGVEELRTLVDSIRNERDIRHWLYRAEDRGIDPL